MKLHLFYHIKNNSKKKKEKIFTGIEPETLRLGSERLSHFAIEKYTLSVAQLSFLSMNHIELLEMDTWK